MVSTLNDTVPPRFTLMSVAKPWMLGSPAPVMSHSLAGLPGWQFSATIGLAGALHGFAAAVVNDQVTLAASALPATSFTRGSVAPPRTVAVYVVAAASGLLGVNVAVSVAAVYVTVAAITAFAGSRSSNVLAPTVAGSIASLNVAVTVVATATPVAPMAGERRSRWAAWYPRQRLS